MKFSKIEQYFETKEGMVLLLKECESVFDTVDDYSNQFMQGLLSTEIELDAVIDTLAGIISFLNPIYSVAITAKKNREVIQYMAIKRDVEGRAPTVDEKGKQVKEKFTSASAEIEATVFVAGERRIRNVIEGYLNSSWAIKNSAEKRSEKLERERRDKRS